MGGDGVVGAGPRVGVAHALALEIHVVVQVVSRRGLRLVIIDHKTRPMSVCFRKYTK